MSSSKPGAWRDFSILLLVLLLHRPVEHQPLHHRALAELRAHLVDRVFGVRGALRAQIDQVGGVGLLGVVEVRQPDPDQAEARAVGLARQQILARREDARGQLRRLAERAGAGADAEVGGLEFQVTVEPAMPLDFSRADTRSDSDQRIFSSGL